MEYKVALISEKHLKEASVIELSVDNKILSKLIVDNQKISLKQVLGDDLYNQVLKEVYDTINVSGHVFSPELKVLLDDYIQPYLVHCVLVDYVITGNYRLTNKGVLKVTDTGAATLSPEELAFARNHFNNKMVSYKAMLIDYLKDKNFITCSSNTDIDTTADTTGWFLDGFRKV